MRFLNSNIIINRRFNSLVTTTYCYCENNSIINIDPNGLLCEWAMFIGSAVIMAATAIKSINSKSKSEATDSVAQKELPVEVADLPPEIMMNKKTIKALSVVKGRYRELFDEFVDSFFATYNHTYRYCGGAVPIWVDESELVASAEVSYWKGPYSSNVENHTKIIVKYGYKQTPTAIGIQRYLSFAIQSIQNMPYFAVFGAVISDVIGMFFANEPDYDSNLAIIEYHFVITP